MLELSCCDETSKEFVTQKQQTYLNAISRSSLYFSILKLSTHCFIAIVLCIETNSGIAKPMRPKVAAKVIARGLFNFSAESNARIFLRIYSEYGCTTYFNNSEFADGFTIVHDTNSSPKAQHALLQTARF